MRLFRTEEYLVKQIAHLKEMIYEIEHSDAALIGKTYRIFRKEVGGKVVNVPVCHWMLEPWKRGLLDLERELEGMVNG